ncbi:hypothetical protein NCS57_00585500 [Fusarium keratoplasticum]|uniref:Uncharacterized protein n=1 Tax=Fusarium keratoplasticum TaxID=1328300 RepID=A0ACC0R3Q3_9HYPO|nr:hypothetical protein NCS57_00585500 [Fusarium keratoplasticum]KAI8671116.1 hypothetical protein NCS57_00585500 [Fusarium keratoplasticum]
MPKRARESQDAGEKTQPPTRRNTERSHSENQERAYIAASRRADRSIEARVQSARNASDIHKKRTGKAFRITEEIVMKEEMYEEEDDDFPRSYRLLNPHMQTANPELNARVDAYLSNRVAMSKLLSATDNDWRNNEINTTFDQFFPNVQSRVRAASHQHWSTGQGFSVPQTLQSPIATPRVPSVGEPPFNMQFHPINYGQQNNGQPNNGQQNNGEQNNGQQNNERNPSTASIPASPTEARNDGPMSPPALTPGSMSHPETPRSRHGSTFGATQSQSYSVRGGFNSESSSFTTQLPAEARMFLGGVGLSNAYGTSMYNEPQLWPAQSFSLDPGADAANQFFGYTADTKPLKEGETTAASRDEQYPDPFAIMGWNNQSDNQGESDSPAKNVLEEWETYIDDSAWSSNQK